MSMRLAEPINSDGRPFEPRIVGQTTLFPLEDELQKLMEETYQRATQINKDTSFHQPGITGFIHDWAKYEPDTEFRDNAQKILATFKETLNPFTEDLNLHETIGIPFMIGPALMGYEAQYNDVKYTLTFRISNKSTYLIASPGLEYTFTESSRMKPALGKASLSDQVYGRILDYVLRRKPLEGSPRHIEAVRWGYRLALKPVLVPDLRQAAKELSTVATVLENNSEKIHQAASLVFFARRAGDSLREVEEKVGTIPPSSNLRELVERTYGEAREILNPVDIGEMPVLNKYFV